MQPPHVPALAVRQLWKSHMANRPGLFLTAALVALLSAPAMVRAAGEPVATAPIPPPLPAAPPAASTPMFVSPYAPAKPKASAPNPVAGSSAKKTPSAAHAQRDNRAVAHRHAKHEQHRVAHSSPLSPPSRRPPRMQPRYYAGEFPPGQVSDGPPFPPPWYDRGPPFAGYYAGPWRRGPAAPW